MFSSQREELTNRFWEFKGNMDRILHFLSAVFAFDWLFRKFVIGRPIKIVLKQKDFLLSCSKPVLKEICCLGITSGT